MCMLLLAVFCFSHSVGGEDSVGNEVMSYGKGRIMQEVDYCEKRYEDVYHPLPSSYLSLPSPIETGPEWPIFESYRNISSDEQCKNDFWEAYLETARNELALPFNKNFANCDSPSLVRISSPMRSENEIIDDTWTFVVSNPTISHAHLGESGEFKIDEINYLNGVYEMVAEKVIFRKVIGDNCIA